MVERCPQRIATTEISLDQTNAMLCVLDLHQAGLAQEEQPQHLQLASKYVAMESLLRVRLAMILILDQETDVLQLAKSKLIINAQDSLQSVNLFVETIK